MEFSVPPSRAMSSDYSVVAREKEIARGSLFTTLRSYILDLDGREDVEVINGDLSIQDFVQRVVASIKIGN